MGKNKNKYNNAEQVYRKTRGDQLPANQPAISEEKIKKIIKKTLTYSENLKDRKKQWDNKEKRLKYDTKTSKKFYMTMPNELFYRIIDIKPKKKGLYDFLREMIESELMKREIELFNKRKI